MRDTSSIGQIGELAVMHRLVRAGWQLFYPYGNSAPYDLAAEKEGRFIRLQVRATQTDNGFISANSREQIRPNTIDFLVVYALGSDTAFVIADQEILGKNVLHIRLAPARSGQVKGTHSANDYSERWDKLDFGA